jgi:hypothetical protein
VGVFHLAAVREIGRAFGKHWKLIWGRRYDHHRRRVIGSYRSAWRGEDIDAAYDKNHDWPPARPGTDRRQRGRSGGVNTVAGGVLQYA